MFSPCMNVAFLETRHGHQWALPCAAFPQIDFVSDVRNGSSLPHTLHMTRANALRGGRMTANYRTELVSSQREQSANHGTVQKGKRPRGLT